MTEEKQNRSRAGLWAAIAVGLILAIGGGTGYWLFSVANLAGEAADNARQAVNEGQFETAIAAADEALAVQPEFLQTQVADMRAIRGISHFYLGNSDLALDEINAALNADGNIFDLYSYRAELLYRAGDLEGASADIDEAEDRVDDLTPERQAYVLALKGILGQELTDIEAGIDRSEFISDDLLAELYVKRALHPDYDAQFADTQLALAVGNESLSEEVKASLFAKQAELAFGRQDYQGALALIEMAFDQAGDLDSLVVDQLLKLRVQSYLAVGDKSAAVEAAQAAAEVDDEAAALALALQAEAKLRSFELEEAQQLADEALAINENQALALRVLAEIDVVFYRYASAQELAEKSVALDPTDQEAQLLLGKLYNYFDDQERSTEQYQIAIDLAPNTAVAFFARAMLALNEFNEYEARILLNEAIAMDPDRLEWLIDRAYIAPWVYFEIAQADIALAAERIPEYPETYSSRIFFANEVCDVELAKEIAIEFSERWPDHRDAQFWRFAELIENEAYDEAGEFLENWAASDDPMFPREDLTYYQALLAFREGDIDSARSTLEGQLESNPLLFNPIALLAEIYWNNEEFEAAEAVLQPYLESYPQSTRGRQLLGDIRLLANDLEGAMRIYSELLAEDPGNVEALVSRGVVQARTQDFNEAEADYTRASDLRPNCPLIYLQQAFVDFQTGDYSGVKNNANKILELDSSIYDVYGLLAEAALGEEDLEEAEKQFLLLLENLDSDLLVDYEITANMAGMLGLEEEMITQIEAGLSIEESGYLYLLQGLYYLNQGDREATQASLQKGLEISDEINLIADLENTYWDSERIAAIENGRFVVRNEEWNFTLSYPPEWEELLSGPETGFDFGIIFEDGDQFATAVVVALDGLAGSGLSSGLLSDLVGDQLNQDPAFESLSVQNVPVADGTGTVREYLLELGGETLKGQQYYYVRGDYGYIITFEAREADFELFVEEFDRIIASFGQLE